MKHVFIKGTNKKYSIREDGEVICNYRYNPHGKFIKQSKILKSNPNRTYKSVFILYSNNTSSVVAVHKLMRCAFPGLIENLDYDSYLPSFRNNNPQDCSISNLYFKDKISSKESKIKFRKSNPESVKVTAKKGRSKSVRNITKWYVASKLEILVNELSDDMYELYKSNLKLKRLIKQKESCQKQQQIMQN